MKPDRRSFLKLFGVSTAAVAAVPAGEPSISIETLPDPPVQLGSTETFLAETMWRERRYDIRDEPLWSILRVEKNAMREQYTLFQNAGAVPLTDTNMHIPGCLIQPEMYCIRKIGFVFSPNTIPALRSAFINRYTLDFRIGRKGYWQAPLSMAFAVGEPDRENGFATLPDAGFYELEIPLIIEAGCYFALDLIGTPIHACGRLTGWGVLKGLHARGVQ